MFGQEVLDYFVIKVLTYVCVNSYWSRESLEDFLQRLDGIFFIGGLARECHGVP